VLSGGGLCDELITRPEESYRLWRIVVCDREASTMRRPWPTWGCRARKKETNPRLNVNGQFISVTAVIDDGAFELLNFVSSDMSWSV
jgi:hypothetical protein